ncbi:hypothetical protein [Ensifer sp. MJa1]|uniref:hypothetical protein n=1 Tax=Ensifer sp. MJa1 TaxID=2919888 RepID=UPI00300A8A61
MIQLLWPHLMQSNVFGVNQINSLASGVEVTPSGWTTRHGKADTLCGPQSDKAHELDLPLPCHFANPKNGESPLDFSKRAFALIWLRGPDDAETCNFMLLFRPQGLRPVIVWVAMVTGALSRHNQKRIMIRSPPLSMF